MAALVSVGVVTPALLLGVLAVPLFFVGVPRTRRAWAAAALRAVAATALLLVLAGAYVERPRPAAGVCVVAAIDRSASVRGAALAAAARWLPRLTERLGARDRLGVLVFGADTHVTTEPMAPHEALAATLTAAETATVDADDTDLAGARIAAASLCDPDQQAALLLFTDGQETAGSLLAEVTLADAPMPVFSVLPAEADLPPATIRRLLVPATTYERGMVPLEAVIESHTALPIEATIALAVDGEPTIERPVTLSPGASVVALPHRALGIGPHTLDAELRLPAETTTARSTVTVLPAPRVLVVTERGSSVVARALGQHGFDVQLAAPKTLRLPTPHHVVILDDVARADLPAAALDGLARWVAAGGALVVTGGQHLFGDAGFVASPLARLLPVELQAQAPEPKEREPVALYLVIDRSNSMGYATRPEPGDGEKMEYARRAALAVLDQLGPGDLVGAVAFDSQPYELGPLRSVADGRTALAARIRALTHGGGTDFKDALDSARRHLVASGRRVRHVILLTDGDTNRRADDHTELIAALARDEITVTTIRIGADTVNLELLQGISAATGGEFHHVANAELLPQLMIRDTRRLIDAPGSLVNAPARVGDDEPMLAGIDEAELPRVARWAVTRLKPDGELRLWLDAGGRRDPLLVTWQYELGRVVALPVDFQSGAAEWSAWSGFGKLWAQLVLWAMPTDGLAGTRRLRVRALPGGSEIRLETTEGDAGPYAIRFADGVDASLLPAGPRHYRTVVPALAPGLHAVTLRAGRREERVTLAVPQPAPSGRERRAVGPNLRLLRQVAERTGGGVDPEPDAVLTARPGVARDVLPLAGVLIPLVLMVLLGDVALRRLG